ncbi:phosphatidylserine decarboxylase, partial [Friedmanniomyces endolithicus]
MRPKIPHHLSLHRVKSSTSSPPTRDSTEPSTPPGNSRHDIPNRTPAIEKDDMLRKKGKDMAASIPLSEQRGDHKNMALVLRVQVIRGRNLAPKDKSGTSDPYLVLTMGDKKEATSIV